MSQRITICLSAFAIMLASTRDARADDQKAAAQVLFEQGRDLVQQKNFAEACPKFAESLRLDQGIGTMLWLADCYENNGQTASAWAEFKEAAGIAALKSDGREAVARRRAAALEPKLSRMMIRVSHPVLGLEVVRDGLTVPSTTFDVPVPVDPGKHVVAVEAPGYRAWKIDVEVLAGELDARVVDVPLLQSAPVLAAPTNAAPVAPVVTPRDSIGTNPLRIVGIATAGVGVVGLGVGTFFGLRAKSSLDDSNASDHCHDNVCDATGKSARDDAKSNATISTGAFVAGAALVAGGAVMYFIAPSTHTTALTVTPSVSPREAGVVLRRSF